MSQPVLLIKPELPVLLPRLPEWYGDVPAYYAPSGAYWLPLGDGAQIIIAGRPGQHVPSYTLAEYHAAAERQFGAPLRVISVEEMPAADASARLAVIERPHISIMFAAFNGIVPGEEA